MVSARRILPLAAACALLAPALQADVHLVRSASGAALIFNDAIGSGWRVNGAPPSDNYLIERRNAAVPFDDAIVSHARSAGVDPSLVKCVILVESNYNPRAVSRKGARGLMQLMPATAARYGVSNVFDAAENIRGGSRYLADLLGMFGGNLEYALAAYNAGEGAVAKHAGIPPYAETREYVRRALVAYHGTSTRSGSPMIGGTFKGMPRKPAPAPAAPRSVIALASTKPVEAAHVDRVQLDRSGRVFTNNGFVSRAAPILSRLEPASVAAAAPAVAPLLGRTAP